MRSAIVWNSTRVISAPRTSAHSLPLTVISHPFMTRCTIASCVAWRCQADQTWRHIHTKNIQESPLWSILFRLRIVVNRVATSCQWNGHQIAVMLIMMMQTRMLSDRSLTLPLPATAACHFTSVACVRTRVTKLPSCGIMSCLTCDIIRTCARTVMSFVRLRASRWKNTYG